MSNAEKALYYKELKRKKKSEKNKNNYMKNRDKYKSKKVTKYSQTKAATIKINQRLKIKEKRNKATDYYYNLYILNNDVSKYNRQVYK